MNIRDLEYVVAVADLKHFSRAAEACHVSQPALSTQIRKLESTLGVTIFERGHGQVLLTECGAEIVSRARLVLRDVAQIEEVARRTRDPRAGTIRLGIFPTLGPYLLPHVMPMIRQQFPELDVMLFEEKTPDLINNLNEGRLDAGLLALPVADDRLTTVSLFSEPFVLAVPTSHPLAVGEAPITNQDLRGHTALLLEDGHCLRDHALDVCQLAGLDEKPGFRATSLETLRQMVATGAGVTLLPVLATKTPMADATGIALRSFAAPPPRREIALVYRKAAANQGFLAELAATLRQLPEELLQDTV